MLRSSAMSKAIFFCICLARAVGDRVWGLMEKTKEKAESVLFSWNTLYQGNDYKWFLSSFKITTASCISELAALCLHCHVPVPGCLSCGSCHCPHCGFLCVAWWSQWQFEILVIRLMLSVLNTWAPASVLRTEGQTRKPSDEAVLQESARTRFFMEVKQDWRAVRGCSRANLVWVTQRVCCTSFPFGLWFLCVFGD